MEDHGASVLLIFQAPGVDEWTSGKPVSSVNSRSAASRLASAFGLAGKIRTDFNITNTVQCFPGKKDSYGDRKPRDKAPPAKVRQHCSEWLRQDIETFQYKRVIVFGAHAHKAVRALGYQNDPRFCFVRHPTGGLSTEDISQTLI